KAKVGLSANKVIATVFWDARGVIHIDYLQKGRTMNGEYYTSLLDRFNEDLKKKRPHLARSYFSSRQCKSPYMLFPWRNFTNYAMNAPSSAVFS
ncbi:Mariner transposase, partial [Caligus rogercresseyi]